MRPLWRLWWDLRLETTAGPVPEGPLLIAPNHSSFIDPWWLAMIFDGHVWFLINRDWWDRSAFWRGFFRAQGCVPVVPDDPGATMDALRAKLAAKGWVCVFPEGKISADGRLQPFRSGIVYMAAATGAPVLPVGIRGGFESLPRGRMLPRRGPIVMRTGAPITFPGSPMDGPPPRAEVRRFRDQLFEAVMALSGRPRSAGSPVVTSGSGTMSGPMHVLHTRRTDANPSSSTPGDT